MPIIHTHLLYAHAHTCLKLHLYKIYTQITWLSTCPWQSYAWNFQGIKLFTMLANHPATHKRNNVQHKSLESCRTNLCYRRKAVQQECKGKEMRVVTRTIPDFKDSVMEWWDHKWRDIDRVLQGWLYLEILQPFETNCQMGSKATWLFVIVSSIIVRYLRLLFS